MALAFGNKTTGKLASTSQVKTVTPTMPSGVAAGDLILLWIIQQEGENGADPGTSSLSPSTGWTEIGTNPDIFPGFHTRVAAWWKIAVGGDTAPTINWSGASQYNWGMAYWTGTDGTSPVDVSSMSTPVSGGTSIVADSLSPTGASDWRIDVYFAVGNGSNPTITQPSGQTLRASDNNTETLCGYACSDEALSASGSTGTRTATSNHTMFDSVAVSLCSGGGGSSVVFRRSLSENGRTGARQRISW